MRTRMKIVGITIEDSVASTADTSLFTELAFAYSFLNHELFDGYLNECVITTNRKYGSFGYYRPRGFNSGGRCTDEISLNAGYMAVRTLRSTLATLTSLMCVKKNVEDGLDGKKGYCGRVWAETMQQVGLMPSSTGKPGGATTGYNNYFYIVGGQAFDIAYHRLRLAKFEITWRDRFPLRSPCDLRNLDVRTYRHVAFAEGGAMEMSAASDLLGIPAALLVPDRATHLSKTCLPLPRKHRGAKDLYVCGGCNDKVWGKPGLRILCERCKLVFLPK